MVAFSLAFSALLLIYSDEVTAQSPEDVELTQSCINETQPIGLSMAVDAQRRTHIFYFTPLNDLVHSTISELTGQLDSEREVIDNFTPSPAHTRSTSTSRGVASCYADLRAEGGGVVVYETTSQGPLTSLAIPTLSESRCDITVEGESLWVSAVVNGALIVARGEAQKDLDNQLIGRSWSTETAIPLGMDGYSAIIKSGDSLWVAAQSGGTQLTLASRPLSSNQAWSLEEIHAIDGQNFGSQLQLSARSGDFTGSVWATHSKPSRIRSLTAIEV